MRKYSGELKMVGQGTTELRSSGNSYSKLSVIEIGDHDVRGVVANGYLASQLIPGTQTDIWTQRLAGSTYLMGVKRDGKLRKAGIKPFVFQVMFAIATCIPFAVLGPALGIEWATWVLFGLLAYHAFRLIEAIKGTTEME